MVTRCQSRVNIGLSTAFWMEKLNEAYRWISQKGNYIWDLSGADVTISGLVNQFALPADCDPGKPMYLVGPIPSMPAPHMTLESIVPYVAWDDAGNQRISELPTMPGMISCWTFRANFTHTVGPPPIYTYTYTGYIFPIDALAVTSQFRVVYHTDVSNVEFTVGSNIYFPTPNCFDNLLIELAEAEARRIYGLAGFETIQKRAESAIVNLLDSFRSTKNVLSGLTDQQKQVSEKKMMAQENT